MKIFVIFLFVLLCCGYVHVMTHPVLHDRDYVRAIVGEASNQTEDTMICIAHALRNRGNIEGVYGYNAEHVWNESGATWHKAWIAWELAGNEADVTHGARNFGTASDLAKYDLTENLLIKRKCGDFYFY